MTVLLPRQPPVHPPKIWYASILETDLLHTNDPLHTNSLLVMLYTYVKSQIQPYVDEKHLSVNYKMLCE